MEKFKGPRLAGSVDDAAHALGVSRRHIYDLLEAGELSSFKSGRRRLIRLRALEAYIAKREAA